MVSVEEMDAPNAYYTNNRVVIDRRIAEDPWVALREYNHHILIGAKNFAWLGPAGGLESGLADYFACSFLDSPNVGEKSAKFFGNRPFIRSLQNRRTFVELQRTTTPQVAGEVWGGFFWDLREKLGSAEADALIALTWLSFTIPDEEDRIASAFLDTLLKAAAARGPNLQETVRTAASARMLSL